MKKTFNFKIDLVLFPSPIARFTLKEKEIAMIYIPNSDYIYIEVKGNSYCLYSTDNFVTWEVWDTNY